ncbi:MAG: hypothetical protein WB586_25355 [Chthoniobacterales bacterium]
MPFNVKVKVFLARLPACDDAAKDQKPRFHEDLADIRVQCPVRLFNRFLNPKLEP